MTLSAAVTVALDGLGAEQGAGVIVAGARAGGRRRDSVRVFGKPEELASPYGRAGVEVIAAPDRITNDEEPVAAVRSRQDASIVLAAADVVGGRSQALVSAGSTGATMAAATLSLRRLHGVRRPALAVQLLAPSRDGSPTLLLDAGANTGRATRGPRSVRVSGRRLQRGRPRGGPSAGRVALGRRGGEEGHA